jgi:hypothetical protein
LHHWDNRRAYMRVTRFLVISAIHGVPTWF